MLEGFIALVLVGVVAVALGVAAAPAESLAYLGMGMAALGLLGGGVASMVYHVRLRHSLRRAGIGSRGWWLHPTRYHASLGPDERERFWPAFVVGAAGFGVSLTGCALVGLAAWKLGVW